MSTHHPISRLDEVQGFIFDIDGTLALADKHLNGYQALPGAVEVLALLESRGTPYVLFTNGSTKVPAQLVLALSKAGIQVDVSRVLTPPVAAISLLKKLQHKRVLVLGVEGVWRPLQEAGIEVVVSPERADDADAVLVGWHPGFGLGDLEAACHAIWAGAKLYTVSNAPYLASREGRTLGISGALCSAIQSVTGVEAVIVGKPSVEAFEVARSMLGVAAGKVAVVGDDPGLENAMAHCSGAVSVAVHTGLNDAQAFDRLPEGWKPHYSLSGVDQLLEKLQ